jgi:hypothetical protein
VQDAAIGNCPSFDRFHFDLDSLVSPEADVRGRQVADARRSSEMARWPEHGAYPCAPYHPMSQGKIERWHQTLKNRILLENYYPPGDLEAQIKAFVIMVACAEIRDLPARGNQSTTCAEYESTPACRDSVFFRKSQHPARFFC